VHRRGWKILSAGRIVFNGEVWADVSHGRNVPTQKRSIGYLFQDYALFPHLTVRDNISFGIRHLSPAVRSERIARTAAGLQLEGLLVQTTSRTFRRPAAARRAGTSAGP
jgi:ABC-type sulfate/molybdate transport systems ATPase subunit